MPTELAHRENSGIRVTLLWNASTDELEVCVSDGRSGESFSLDVDGASPLDVFYHPFAYAARRGIEFGPRDRPADDDCLVGRWS